MALKILKRVRFYAFLNSLDYNSILKDTIFITHLMNFVLLVQLHTK